ncbi:hypothetical protein [Roseovarius salis]|uniref:hypothetical protein n=1 Tax=Roseovarius salis TaxID=3376063 RepID=UPI0037CAA2C3
MSEPLVLNPHPPELEPFLYAFVGEDPRGSPVTVLSALARLNLDPWAEAADLAALGREAAATRFGALLSRVRDVPALEKAHGPVGRELAHLLPDRSARPGRAGPASAKGAPLAPGLVWAIAAALLLAAQMFFGGSSGTGE